MSGYSSKAEAVEVIRLSIQNDSAGTGLSRDVADYNLSAIVRECVYSRGTGYGWGITYSSDLFTASLRAHIRKPARRAARAV